MANSIFRRKSLDTLSSPEQLDQAMQVTRPLGWVGLAACFLLLAIALAWGVMGEIPTLVRGSGILLKEGAVHDVVALKTGQLMDIRVDVDDMVTEGQELARVSRAGMLPDSAAEGQDLEIRIVSPHDGRVLEIFKNTGQVIRTGEALLNIEKSRDRDKPLSAFIYFSPRDGKKVLQGMDVRIIPSTVNVEAHGYMRATVGRVSSFPATGKGMLRVLRNPDLVTRLSAGGAPIAVTAELVPDPSAVSRYRWSSGAGPAMTVESGTLCTAQVVVNRQAPITLVLPFLKRNILGVGEGGAAR